MEEETQNTSEQTAERLKQFHEQSNRQPKEPIHSDKVLAICACIISVGGALGSFFTFNGIECAIYAFLSFTTGVFLYTDSCNSGINIDVDRLKLTIRLQFHNALCISPVGI